MKIFEILKRTTDESMKLSELVNAFEKMCESPIDGIDKDDELYLYETGVFTSTGQPMFHFLLVRQFPNEDEEYIQVKLDIQYKISEQNKQFLNSVWSEDVEEDFFSFVRNSSAYLFLVNEKIEKTSVFMDET